MGVLTCNRFRLAEKSVGVYCELRNLLNQNPILNSVEVNHSAAVWSVARNVTFILALFQASLASNKR